MKRLLVYLKDYKKECILAPLFKMLEATFELFVPLVVAALIDQGIGNNDRTVIYYSFAVLVGLALVGLIASVTAQFFAARAAVSFATNLRHAMFKHLLNLGFVEIDEIGTSTMITRMTSDVNQLQNGVNMILRLLLRSPFVVFGAMIMAFTIDFKSALIFLVIIVLLCVVVFGLMRLNIRQSKTVQERLENVLKSTRENLGGVRVIRAFCREKDEVEAFHEYNNTLTEALNRAGNVSALMNPLTYVLINIAIILLIYIDAIQVSVGILTAGQVIALYNYMSQILVELIKMANLIVLINKFIASAKRVESVFEIERSQVEGNAAVSTSKSDKYIVFDNVSLTYNGAGEPSLENISFEVNKGETIGIIGGTGSGKTSLVHLIPRFYDATEGQVIINGTNVNDYSFAQLRKLVGIVMQKAVLFNGNIKENLSWANNNAEEDEYIEALENAQAMEVVEGKGGLEAEVEQGGRNFSGGQRQRISIARTLLGKPEILILDDSSSALDYLTDLKLRQAIGKLDYKPTVFIVSQRSSSLRNANRIIVLDDGKIVGNGTHDELINNCSVYQEICESQSQNKSKEDDDE